jgi:hypothetical protein
LPESVDGLGAELFGPDENVAAGAGSLVLDELDESEDFSDFSDEEEDDDVDFVLSPARLSVR